MRIISTQDYKLPDGKIDWPRYQEAQSEARKLDVADGVYCARCGAYKLFPRSYGLCAQCREMADISEVTHDRLVRCPNCGGTRDASSYDLYQEGEHVVPCENCEQEFTVTTHIAYSFTSPARIISKDKDED